MSYSVVSNIGKKEQILGSLKGVDMNSTADQLISLIAGNKNITKIICINGSMIFTTAVGGIYTGAGKTGSQYVNATQSYIGLTTTHSLELTVALDYIEGTSLYFTLSTAEGLVSTCDIYVIGEVYQ